MSTAINLLHKSEQRDKTKMYPPQPQIEIYQRFASLDFILDFVFAEVKIEIYQRFS